MNWKKKGLIFDINKFDIPWLKSHAMTPTPLLYEDRIRVFYTGRAHNGESKISYVDLDLNDPTKIIYVHKEPLFELGKNGMFDDSGTICTSVIRVGSKIYLYYTAYSMSVKVPYRNSIGVAVSDDNGNSFRRMFDGPILDRDRLEPFFVISPCVIKQNDLFHLWYASATDWLYINNNFESVYHIKYAHSIDGLNWVRENISCIIPKHLEEANARPSVIIIGERMFMWYTFRGSRDFRNGIDSYRIGFAEANISNPTIWTRKDEEYDTFNDGSEYDNLMQAYPAVIAVDEKNIMFYNGNAFGKDGFCCAISS